MTVVDLVFCYLSPHAASMLVIMKLPKVLSAVDDNRCKHVKDRAYNREWYTHYCIHATLKSLHTALFLILYLLKIES